MEPNLYLLTTRRAGDSGTFFIHLQNTLFESAKQKLLSLIYHHSSRFIKEGYANIYHIIDLIRPV